MMEIVSHKLLETKKTFTVLFPFSDLTRNLNVIEGV